MKVFFDLEFTGLHQNTTPISIGLVTEDGKKFYAEFRDLDVAQVDSWCKTNVMPNLQYMSGGYSSTGDYVIVSSEPRCTSPNDWHDVSIVGYRSHIAENLKQWFNRLGSVEIWGDCLGYDWVLFCELFGGAMGTPTNIYYIPFDISTLFKVKGVDPDISREEFAGCVGDSKHNALHDAEVIKLCYEKLMQMKTSAGDDDN